MTKALIAFLAVSLAACSEGTAPAPSDAAIGSYSLVKVAGQPLPYAGTVSTVVSGTLVIRADHTLDLKFTTTAGSGTPTASSTAGSGTWQRSGGIMPIQDFTISYTSISGVYNDTGITLKGSMFDTYGGDFFWSKTP